jgi:hypothetical protein
MVRCKKLKINLKIILNLTKKFKMNLFKCVTQTFNKIKILKETIMTFFLHLKAQKSFVKLFLPQKENINKKKSAFP